MCVQGHFSDDCAEVAAR